MNIILGILLAYIIGSIPTAYIVGKMTKNIDIREHGSKNMGATNVFRVIGKKWGIAVLVIDMIKGLLPVLILPRFISADIDYMFVQCIIGVSAVCGHNWTIFLKFKGGKGVATTTGALAGIFPPALGVSFLLFVIVVAMTRYISLGSIIGALSFPVSLWIFYRDRNEFPHFLILAFVLVVFIVYRHKTNIQRLCKGTENKISFKKSQ